MSSRSKKLNKKKFKYREIRPSTSWTSKGNSTSKKREIGSKRKPLGRRPKDKLLRGREKRRSFKLRSSKRKENWRRPNRERDN